MSVIHVRFTRAELEALAAVTADFNARQPRDTWLPAKSAARSIRAALDILIREEAGTQSVPI